MDLLAAVCENYDARAVLEEATLSCIKFRNKIMCDTHLDSSSERRQSVSDFFKKNKKGQTKLFLTLLSPSPHPTQGQLAWLTGRFDQWSIRLRDKGNQHITDFSEEGDRHSLKLKGGKGYTNR